jgi:hypothetical protein
LLVIAILNKEHLMADFLRLYRGTEPVNAALSPQQKQDYQRHFQDWIISLTKAGKISSCGPLAQGGRTLAGARSLITEGPYAEAKDLVGGYTLSPLRILTRQPRLRAVVHFSWSAVRWKSVRCRASSKSAPSRKRERASITKGVVARSILRDRFPMTNK